MSRIGNAPLQLPSTVSAKVEGLKVIVTGPLGSLEMVFSPKLKVEVDGQTVTVKRKGEDKESKSLHGTTRAKIANMVLGVEKNWQRKLELVGVGFRSSINGEKLTLNVGFSHPVEIMAPSGIKFSVEDNTKINVLGIDKELVGQTAARIRAVRPPEPYQGKGIRFSGEYIKRKAGKAGKVGAGAK